MPNQNPVAPPEDDMYADGAPGESQNPQDEGSSHVVTLPRYCAPGAKPGDVISVRVESVHEEELQGTVESHSAEEEAETAPEPETATGPADAEMSSMME